jgi:hypothetical protein
VPNCPLNVLLRELELGKLFLLLIVGTTLCLKQVIYFSLCHQYDITEDKEILSPSTWHQHIVAISLYCITYGGEVKKLFLDINLRGHQINPPVYAMVIELLMPSPQE